VGSISQIKLKIPEFLSEKTEPQMRKKILAGKTRKFRADINSSDLEMNQREKP